MTVTESQFYFPVHGHRSELIKWIAHINPPEASKLFTEDLGESTTILVNNTWLNSTVFLTPLRHFGSK